MREDISALLNCIRNFESEGDLPSPLDSYYSSFNATTGYKTHNTQRAGTSIPQGLSEKLIYDNIPSYITKISLLIESKEKTNCDISIINEYGEEETIKYSRREDVKYNTEEITFEINTITTKIKIIPKDNTSLLLGYKIRGYELRLLLSMTKKLKVGLTQSDDFLKNVEKVLFESIEDKRREINSLQIEVKNFSDNLNTLKNEEKNIKSELESIKEYRDEAASRLDDIKKDQSENLKVLRIKTQELHKIEETLLNEKNLLIDTEISRKRSQSRLVSSRNRLKRYKKNEMRYSEDFDSYKEELSQQNLGYWILFFIMLISGFILTFHIYTSSLLVIDKFTNDTTISLTQLFISRTPLIILNSLILGLIIKFLMIVMNKIIDNNTDIANLKRIVFLVKETVQKQSNDLDVNDDKVLEMRVNKKMEIVREYIFNQNVTPDNTVPIKSESDASNKAINSFIEAISKLKS